MPSEILATKVKDESMVEMQLRQDDKRRSMQYHSPKSSKEKCSFPNGIKNVDFLEKFGALKTEKLPRQTAKDRQEVKKNSVASPLGTSPKPWPSRKVTGLDDPVKNMTNVPFYLKRLEQGDNVYDKALNVGVLEWELLERWTQHQKCSTDVGSGDSASVTTEPSTFSTFGVSNQSCRTTPSPLSQGKTSPALPRSKAAVSDSSAKVCEKGNSRRVEGLYGSRIDSTKFPTQLDKHLDADFCSSADLLVQKHDKRNSIDSDSKAISSKVRLAPRSATLSPRSKLDDTTVTRVVERHYCNLMKEEKPVVFPNSLPLANDISQFSDDHEGIWDYLQEGVDNGCLGSDLTTDCWLAGTNDHDHSHNLADEFEIIGRYTQVPHSCPLPLAIGNNEPDIPTDRSICKNAVNEIYDRGSFKQLEANTTQKTRKCEAKTKAAAGKKSSFHPLNAGPKRMSRSSSLKEGSSEEQCQSISLLHGDQATRNNKGRQSPLRRILDPIMKPKNNLHLNGMVASSPSRHSGELKTDRVSHVLNKLSNTTVGSTCQAKGSMIASNELSNNGKVTQNEERHATQMKQALLQLAWKNGLPLFMFSSCDGDVLAAAITARSVGNNDGPESIYRMFSVNGSKKKSMFWSHPVNKVKKHQLISNVVGQLKVSLGSLISSEHGNFHAVREFVLLDPDKPVDSRATREMVAIVVEAPPSAAKYDASTVACHGNCRGSLSTYSAESIPNDERYLQNDQCNNYIGQSGISVIIPSGVHGLSADGEPSPLIERWRSGGACDCGGWDEGCMLTILGNKIPEYNRRDSILNCQTTDGTHRFELIVQGASQEKRRAFSMVSFKEGMYTVNFQSSISLLQAFAICVSVLHGRNASTHSTLRKSLQDHIINDKLGEAPGRTQDGDPAIYVPNHPPLSPVGRA